MHRGNLLGLIESYQSRHQEEQSTIERLIAFVNAYERCFERDCWAGHVTGSAWVVDPSQSKVLLTHHKKLDIWVQLGGHSDGDPDTPAVALREAQEESGLPVSFVNREIFDIDIHEIPARKDDPAHFHFDVRFAFQAANTNFVVSEESNDLAWVDIVNLAEFSQETSLLRMRDKWLAK